MGEWGRVDVCGTIGREEDSVMVYHGHIENGAIVLDASAELPEGAAVKVELLPM